MKKIFGLMIGAFVALMPVAASAQEAANVGNFSLKLDGAVAAQAPKELKIQDLEKMPSYKIATTTPWHTGVVEFEGVLMKDLVALSGSTSSFVVVTALNRYVTKIPVDDFKKYNVILAYKLNGQYMPVRDKGPLFIIYPYDSTAALNVEKYYSRSAWQVAKITFE